MTKRVSSKKRTRSYFENIGISAQFSCYKGWPDYPSQLLLNTPLLYVILVITPPPPFKHQVHKIQKTTTDQTDTTFTVQLLKQIDCIIASQQYFSLYDNFIVMRRVKMTFFKNIKSYIILIKRNKKWCWVKCFWWRP